MTYLVTARKWRPMVFEDVVGQDHITTTLRNAIATNRLSHAYIFCGPRGIGKTTTARILAKAINCLQPTEQHNPDNTCELCREITEGRSLNVFEIDGASNRGIDDVRNLRDAVRYPPAKGKYKVYIIDEVHMLTKEAFNALLKTLEEPPPYILFIFATTEAHKVPLTILSRCQRFEFHRMSIQEIKGRLQLIAREEKITISDDALFIIAKKADGSMRDAQSIFDQIVSYCGENVSTENIVEMLNLVDEEMYFRVTDLIYKQDIKGVLQLVQEIIERGYDLREFLAGLNEHLRNILVVKATDAVELVETTEIYKQRYFEVGKMFSETDLLRFIKIVTETEQSIRWSQQQRFRLELALVQLVKMDKAIELSQLIHEISALKERIDQQPSELFSTPKLRIDGTSVKGDVKVSQPELKPSQKVISPLKFSEPKSVYPSSDSSTIKNISDKTSQGFAEQKFTVDEIRAKWHFLVEEVGKQKVLLGTMLNSSTPIEITDNRVKIACPDTIHLDELKRNKDILTELAQKVYGAKLRLETILSKEKLNISDSANSSDITGNNLSPEGESDLLNHPVVKAIVKEFKAEVIE